MRPSNVDSENNEGSIDRLLVNELTLKSEKFEVGQKKLTLLFFMKENRHYSVHPSMLLIYIQ